MNQEQEQLTYTIDISIDVYGFEKIGLTYSKRFTDGKKYGHLNDFQDYEKLDVKAVANFLKAKAIPFAMVRKNMRCKNLVLYQKVLTSILKEFANL